MHMYAHYHSVKKAKKKKCISEQKEEEKHVYNPPVYMSVSSYFYKTKRLL